MTDTPTSPVTDSNELKAAVTSTGTGKSQSFDIAPEHQHHADAILAMDPMQVPTPHKFPEGWATNFSLRASALADPEDRKAVSAKLAALGPVSPEEARAAESAFTAEVMQSQRSRQIVRGGVGKDATPYHREWAAIAHEVDDLQRQYAGLQMELERVLRHDTKLDPETGEPKPVPVYAITGQRAKAYVERQHDIERQIRLLIGDGNEPGLEGARRIQKAMYDSVQLRVGLERQANEEAEAKRRAEQINSERRINARAEAIASMQRSNF